MKTPRRKKPGSSGRHACLKGEASRFIAGEEKKRLVDPDPFRARDIPGGRFLYCKYLSEGAGGKKSKKSDGAAGLVPAAPANRGPALESGARAHPTIARDIKSGPHFSRLPPPPADPVFLLSILRREKRDGAGGGQILIVRPGNSGGLRAKEIFYGFSRGPRPSLRFFELQAAWGADGPARAFLAGFPPMSPRSLLTIGIAGGAALAGQKACGFRIPSRGRIAKFELAGLSIRRPPRLGRRDALARA